MQMKVGREVIDGEGSPSEGQNLSGFLKVHRMFHPWHPKDLIYESIRVPRPTNQLEWYYNIISVD